LSSEKQQLIGVKVARVEKTSGRHTLRALGRVVPDETRIYRINAATDGWVKKMLPVTTDSLVRKDELLATFYAPEFFSAMKAYLYGLRSLDRFQKSGKETKEQIELTDANIENYRNALRNLGMTEHQLDEIMHTRQGGENVEIRAPAAGFILTRNLTQGERFQRGTELYRIADLSKVWIVVNTFETEASSFKPGMPVRVSAPNLKKTFFALVANVPPRFDSTSRTLQVRLEADNPGLLLRPDMFVDVELPINLPPAITVPADAVLDSGLKKTVFVDQGNGIFEPREVETGWRIGNRIEIVKGVKTGEQIVISGNFLIDSESRLELAAAGMVGAISKDPVCGADVSVSKAEKVGRKVKFGNVVYYFCSDKCKEQFNKNPAYYVKKP
jgi:RND family efflux transporter MFP subunit